MPSMSKKIIKIGKILHKSPIAPNILIAKVNSFVEEGTEIFNENTEKIGVAIETFGPTDSPYLRIKIMDNSQANLQGDIFIIEGEKKKVHWRKKPKKKRFYRRGKNWKSK